MSSKLSPQSAALARAYVERNCRKVSVTLTVRSGEVITCEGLEFHSIAGVAMVVHMTPWGAKGFWQVTVPVTGLLIGNGYKTRDEAMIHSQARVNRRPGCLNDAIRQHAVTRESAA